MKIGKHTSAKRQTSVDPAPFLCPLNTGDQIYEGDRLKSERVIIDSKTSRDRSLQRLEGGAVTSGYSANRAVVIKLLNEPLATERVCVLRYRRHHFMASGLNSQSVAQECLQHSTTQRMFEDILAMKEQHAEDLASLQKGFGS